MNARAEREEEPSIAQCTSIIHVACTHTNTHTHTLHYAAVAECVYFAGIIVVMRRRATRDAMRR